MQEDWEQVKLFTHGVPHSRKSIMALTLIYVTATLSRNYSGHSNPLSYADCRLTPLVNNNYYILIYLIFEQVKMYYSLSFPILSMAIKPFMGPSYHTLVLELLSLVCAMKHLSATVI